MRTSRLSACCAHLLALTCASALAQPPLTPTGPAGGSMPYDNRQPTLTLNQVVQSSGAYPSRGGASSSDESFLGSIRSFAWSFDTDLPAQGGTFSIAGNNALFSVTGATFGGDGGSVFGLPDLRGRTIIGASPSTPLGMAYGSAETTLSVVQMPSHAHTISGQAQPTTSTGNGQAVDNMQPSLSLGFMIASEGAIPSRDAKVSEATFVGRISTFTGDYVPAGYLPADGRLLTISDHAALATVLGNTFGGDGVNDFALPDLRARTVMGAGTGPGLASRQLGDAAGVATLTLATDQLPAHAHELPDASGTSAVAGQGMPLDNLQPSLALNYLIALEGVFPVRDAALSGATVLGEVTAFAGDFAPGGWALADGSLLTIAGNPALYSLLGTSYGGDGRTTFALPDLRGRIIAGQGGADPFGSVFGAETVTLLPDQLPIHSHLAPVPEPGSGVLLMLGITTLFGLLPRQRASFAARGQSHLA